MKKYQIIYADPPWEYKTWTAKGGNKSASAHYPVMDINQICKLPIKEIADKDCVLFLWATFPNLLEAFQVIDSWGFKYKTVGFVWVKVYEKCHPVMGLGYWTRSNAEICLIATRGKIRRKNAGIGQIIIDKLQEHSAKPSQTRDLIVKLMGDLPRIELFTRPNPQMRLDGTNTFDGWDVIGNEISGQDIRETLENMIKS